MWLLLHSVPSANSSVLEDIRDLLITMARNIILCTGAIYLVWQLLVITNNPLRLSQSFPIMLTLAGVCALAVQLLPRHFIASQVIWQAGLAIIIVLSVSGFHEPLIGFFFALLPAVAVLVMGWAAGLLAEGLVIATVMWCSRWLPGAEILLPYAGAIILAGLITGLLGWLAARQWLLTTQWSLLNYEDLRLQVDQTHEQQLELNQAKEDLLQANSELARLSDRLKELNQMAEQSRRAKEEFVANVSHELRTPLNMIIGFSEMIPKLSDVYGVALPSALLSDIAAIQRNGQHLSSLVDDVLDLSQVDSGRMVLNREWVSPRQIVEEATTAVQVLYQTKGLQLATDVQPDLPLVHCDTTRVRQVILNLLSNAGRFTERGGVTVRAIVENAEIIVSVTDTGPGIDPQDQKRLFEPFQQLDGSIRRLHGGNGLGLSISKRLVELHGGRMWLQSAIGAGTTFFFSLPAASTPPPAYSSAEAIRWVDTYHHYEPRTRRSKAPPPNVKPRYVVVEEGDALQRLLSRYVEDVEVVPYDSLSDAIQELHRSPAQMLIVNSPGAAVEAAGHEGLSDLPYNIPAVTCWMPGSAVRQLGVASYLVKPITLDTMLGEIDRIGSEVKTILLVDDQPEVLRLYVRMLESAGRSYRLLQTTNGRRAINLMRERRPDLVLMDLIMPGMDGFQVLQTKFDDSDISSIPVIVMSSKDPTGEPIRCNRITITRGGGLTTRDLVDSIQAVNRILVPSTPPVDPTQLEKPFV